MTEARAPVDAPTPLRATAAAENPSLRLKGTFRMEVRGRKQEALPTDLREEPAAKRTRPAPEVTAEATAEAMAEAAPAEACFFVPDSDEETVPRQPSLTVKPTEETQVLRISAGRAAAAAGIHPYADVGEMFLEFLYQDLPELLMQDAALAGVELVSPQAERARLLSKSGDALLLDKILKEAATAPGVEGAQVAREAVASAVTAAEEAKRLSPEEAQELRKTLELEINLEFGARHEDAALAAYEARLGRHVYGQQLRVSVPLPAEGAEAALGLAFLPPHLGLRPKEQDDVKAVKAVKAEVRPYFRFTGFVDALADVPRGSPAPVAAAAKRADDAELTETIVVEVKHRMGKIKDPPEIYDVVQLCSYCRALGCSRGDLVQCLRTKGAGDVGVLHVTRIDFSEGSPDRRGWDQHVLPNLYALASAVYSARKDLALRLQLLAASPEERLRIIGELCPHL